MRLKQTFVFLLFVLLPFSGCLDQTLEEEDETTGISNPCNENGIFSALEPRVSEHTMVQEIDGEQVTRKYLVHDIDDQWQADLADVSAISRYNNGHRFILTVIDIFSRYAWARPLKSKHGIGVAKAFKSIFDEGRIPKRIQTDQGTEFENRHVK